MRPWGPRGHRRGTRSASGDLVTRIHNISLDISAGLPKSFDVSNPGTAAADSSSDEDEDDLNLHPSRNKPSSSRPLHKRSMSQPFPNIFAKKVPKNDSAGTPSPDDERSDDDMMFSKATGRQSVLAHGQGKRPAVVGSRDLTTGTCMTCGGTMRWPKELDVFKCSLCATVNDLTANQSSKSPAPILSLEQTRRLIRQGIHAYLCRQLVPDNSRTDENGTPQHTRAYSRSPQDGSGGPGLDQSPRTHLDRPIARPAASSISHLQSQPEDRQAVRRKPVGPRPPGTRKLSDSHGTASRVPSNDLPDRGLQARRSRLRSFGDDAKRIHKPLEGYIATCFASFDCVNTCFPAKHMPPAPKVATEPVRRKPVPSRLPPPPPTQRRSSRPKSGKSDDSPLPELDPKLLLLGDVGENGMWWTGTRTETPRSHSPEQSVQSRPSPYASHVTSNSPQINYEDLSKWYHLVNNVAEDWFAVYEALSEELEFPALSERDLRLLEMDLLVAQEHVQRHLMKATEVFLKRPGRPLLHPGEVRFLLIILENPQLHNDVAFFSGLLDDANDPFGPKFNIAAGHAPPHSGVMAGQHSGVIKRIVGLMSNSSSECHDHLIAWLSRVRIGRFSRNKDLISGFLAYRMQRSTSKKQDCTVDITAGLIPQLQAGRSGAYLHDEIGGSRGRKKPASDEKKRTFSDDWQIRAAARVLALFFAANNTSHTRRADGSMSDGSEAWLSRERGVSHGKGQKLPTSDFYVTMIDYSADLVSDFEAWETKRGNFAFCQYPFLLSIRAKTEILEHDAKRQMQVKARDAFFDSIMSHRAVNQYFSLDVRRDCLVDDSLKAVSEVIGSGSEDLKKALRITFQGEEGIDGGGLRKEWFLMLIREVFNPDYGMFIYDDESQFCYFNPNSFETTNQFFLVGVVMGLAIYNSTILDVALPPYAFRKLLASAPAHAVGPSAHTRPTMKYTLEDLASYRPQLARGLKQLLDFEGDVEATFGLDFTIDVEKYGTSMPVSLCHGGERKAVTNVNRKEYVDLYILYMLDTSVKKQFEPFMRGFYKVCGGNAFSLFRPEEIELLVRGSDQPLDIPSLRAVAVYDNWEKPQPDGSEPVVGWFWDTFERAEPSEQRKLLSFITGSDRIPATGASTLTIRISCLGDDESRFPIARTCFNSISLFQYSSVEKLESKVWRAVHESEGFGLK